MDNPSGNSDPNVTFPYLCNCFLHRVGQTRDLIPGLPLQVGDPVCQLPVRGLEVPDQIPFVPVQLLLEPLDERGTVTGVAFAYGTLVRNRQNMLS
jgi:hypothetical protein